MNPSNLSILTASQRYHHFLSIGTRGVGKTVFFVGHYGDQTPSSSLGFDCDDPDTQNTIDKIRTYVAQTGKYPPATMKMTNFDFWIQRQQGGQSQPLCHVCWWDTPGESCQLHNPAFLTMLTSVSGISLFLDGQTLVNSVNNPQALQEHLKPIQTLVNLLYCNGYHYPIALIVTKCDLLKSEEDWTELKGCLRGLTEHLDKLKCDYRLFYSEIPIIKTDNGFNLQMKGQENPLVWLVEQAEAAAVVKPIPTPVTQKESNQVVSKVRKLNKALGLLFKRKSTVFASFLAMTIVLSLGGVLFVEKAVNSEQNTPAMVPTQS